MPILKYIPEHDCHITVKENKVLNFIIEQTQIDMSFYATPELVNDRLNIDNAEDLILSMKQKGILHQTWKSDKEADCELSVKLHFKSIMDSIKKFLIKNKHLLKLSGIENETGIPKDTLRKWLSGTQDLSLKWEQPLKDWRIKFGEEFLGCV